ncbi:hypothetical protein Tco_0374274 [Tanacetum coccineum]
MPHDSPLPRVHSLGSDEGSMTLHELMVLCTALSKKVESLESDLKQTKLTYGAAYTKLIMKVKKLENRIKSSKARRRVRLIVSEDEGDLEDPSKLGRKIAQLDKDEGITLVQMGAQTQGRHEHDLEPNFDFTAPEKVYTTEPDISTANVLVSTAGAEVKERQRIARVHEEANTFNVEEWDNIQDQIEADEELTQKLLAEERGKFSEKLSFDEIKELFEITMKRVKDFVPMESNRLVPKISTGSSKRTAKTELKNEGSKRQKNNEEQSAEEEKELSEEEL